MLQVTVTASSVALATQVAVSPSPVEAKSRSVNFGFRFRGNELKVSTISIFPGFFRLWLEHSSSIRIIGGRRDL